VIALFNGTQIVSGKVEEDQFFCPKIYILRIHTLELLFLKEISTVMFIRQLTDKKMEAN
jgi:hypothetical protein